MKSKKPKYDPKKDKYPNVWTADKGIPPPSPDEGPTSEKERKPKKYAKGGKVCRGGGKATKGTKFKGVF